MELTCSKCGYKWKYRVDPPKRYATCPNDFAKVKTDAPPSPPADNRPYEQRMGDFLLQALHEGYDMRVVGDLIEALKPFVVHAKGVSIQGESLARSAVNFEQLLYSAKLSLTKKNAPQTKALVQFLTQVAGEEETSTSQEQTLKTIYDALVEFNTRMNSAVEGTVPMAVRAEHQAAEVRVPQR